MPRSASSTPETVATFQQGVADAFASLATTEAISAGGSLPSKLNRAGIKGDVTAGDASPVKVTVVVDENHGLPAGTTRDQYNQSALDAFDAKAVRAAKESVYQQIRSMARSSHLGGDQAIALLGTLGYADASKPSAVTYATVEIPARRKDGYDSRSLTLQGSFTEEEIVTKVTAALGEDPFLRADKAIMDAFGDVLQNQPKAVRVTGHRVETVWPARSEFAGE